MKHNLSRHIGIALYALLVASCADDVPVDNPVIEPGEVSDKICFKVSDEDPSRGSRTDGLRCGGAYIKNAAGSDSVYLGLTVSDMPVTKASRAAQITTNDYDIRMTCLLRRAGNVYDYYFTNTLFTKNEYGIWASDPEYWWLSTNTNYKFFGYAPADVDGATFIADTQTWEPKIDYTVPANVLDQTDLLYCNIQARNVWMVATPLESVRMYMRHAMACIAFRTGKDMAAGTINKITIRDAAGRGVLNLADGEWTLDTETLTDFYADLETESADDVELTDNDAQTYFMMLPGGNIEGTTVEIDFTDSNNIKTVYTGRLPGEWQAGKQYMYNITINPELDIDIVPDKQDAHYVICKARVVADNMQNGQQWRLSVSASDGADVTVTNELNSLQRLGYWIDKIIEDGKEPVTARGTSTLTGTGDNDIYIFLPENASYKNRTITLSLRVDGSDKVISERTFEQVCPALAGTFMWEQIDESAPVQYGFDWTREAYYAYMYPAPSDGNEAYRKYCQSVIDENVAGEYAQVEQFDDSYSTTKYMIAIDYGRLSDLRDVAENLFDGWFNTKDLYKRVGTGALGAFEAVLQNIYKTEDGYLTENAFRLGNGAPGEAPAPTGENNIEMTAIGECMLKNRWYMKRTVSDQGDVGYLPYIEEDDIVWYLPAVDQYTNLPTNIIELIEADKCWSSTASGASGSNDLAYLGNGTTAPRKAYYKVRAIRR